jgi:hypothetical protein
VALAGALLGLILAALSTHDFARHLDRQVHNIHCGVGASHPGGDSGCKVAMLSTYSSVLRGSIWGGIPISLPAMAVFAFLLFYGAEMALTGRDQNRRSTTFYLAAACVPVGASLVMGSIAAFALGQACTVCVGIYLASALCFAGAFLLWRQAHQGDPPALQVRGGRPDALAATIAAFGPRHFSPAERRYLLVLGGLAAGCLLLPLLAYVMAAPDQSRFARGCGQLSTSGDPQNLLVPLSPGQPGARASIEVLDPLCPACSAFEQRLHSSGLDQKLARRALLFPLESGCNWMVERTLHPGACTVSEAVLCAGESSGTVITWAFKNQEAIIKAAQTDPQAAGRMVLAAFPHLRACVGSPAVKARLNRALRWAVKNNLPVLTPQLYVDNVKVCDEDLDLGLEYTLSRMLRGQVTP